jgi:hypothetical protein
MQPAKKKTAKAITEVSKALPTILTVGINLSTIAKRIVVRAIEFSMILPIENNKNSSSSRQQHPMK